MSTQVISRIGCQYISRERFSTPGLTLRDDPLNVTARLRPIVIVGFEGDGWLPVHDLVEIVQDGLDGRIVVYPRPNLDRTLLRIKADFGDNPWISVLGIARLDLADRLVFEALLAALEGRNDDAKAIMPTVDR